MQTSGTTNITIGRDSLWWLKALPANPCRRPVHPTPIRPNSSTTRAQSRSTFYLRLTTLSAAATPDPGDFNTIRPGDWLGARCVVPTRPVEPSVSPAVILSLSLASHAQYSAAGRILQCTLLRSANSPPLFQCTYLFALGEQRFILPMVHTICSSPCVLLAMHMH